MKTSVFGYSSLGLPIIAYEFRNGGPEVLILGGVHGDEVEGVLAAQALLHRFMESFPYQLNLVLVPQFNIEGVLNKTRGNARGVDLNRNLKTRDWSPEVKTPRYHPGPSAGSEPENQALMKYIDEKKPQWILSLHSWQPVLNVNGDCRAEAEVLAQHTGYKIDDDIGYPTPGCLGTYAGLERQSPTLTYEIERGQNPAEILKMHIPAILESLKVTEKKEILMSFANSILQIWDEVQAGAKIDDLSIEKKAAIEQTIHGLDTGTLRVCEKVEGQWQTHEWIKKGILLYFRLQKMSVMNSGDFNYYDKIPVKKWTGQEGVRVVPHALARRGSFVESGAILMPSYVNVGAYVGSGTMVDTWATVGSCAQIGKNVHLSGGVGIGGVLEPVQASPVIVEDNAFIGSRCIVVEGAVIEEGAVLGAGVTITASTKIIDVTGSQEKIYQGRVPKNCVVIPGTVTKKFAAGEYGTPCALIIGQRKPSTDLKTSLTDALRDFQVSV